MTTAAAEATIAKLEDNGFNRWILEGDNRHFHQFCSIADLDAMMSIDQQEVRGLLLELGIYRVAPKGLHQTPYKLDKYLSDLDINNNPTGCWNPTMGSKCDCPACGGYND